MCSNLIFCNSNHTLVGMYNSCAETANRAENQQSQEATFFFSILPINVCKKHEKSNIRPVLSLQDSSGTCPEVPPGLLGQARPDLSPTYEYSGYLVFPRDLNYFCSAKIITNLMRSQFDSIDQIKQKNLFCTFQIFFIQELKFCKIAQLLICVCF